MNDESPRRGMTEWAFYFWSFVLFLCVFGLGMLFLMARKGELMAIIALVVIGVLAIIALTVWTILTIGERTNRAEERRFRENARENMAFMEQQARLTNLQIQAQGRQTSYLLQHNRLLSQRLDQPDADLDVDALSWEVYDNAEAERR